MTLIFCPSQGQSINYRTGEKIFAVAFSREYIIYFGSGENEDRPRIKDEEIYMGEHRSFVYFKGVLILQNWRSFRLSNKRDKLERSRDRRTINCIKSLAWRFFNRNWWKFWTGRSNYVAQPEYQPLLWGKRSNSWNIYIISKNCMRHGGMWLADALINIEITEFDQKCDSYLLWCSAVMLRQLEHWDESFQATCLSCFNFLKTGWPWPSWWCWAWQRWRSLDNDPCRSCVVKSLCRRRCVERRR